MSTVYDFTVKDRAGNDVSLKDYEGKVCCFEKSSNSLYGKLCFEKEKIIVISFMI